MIEIALTGNDLTLEALMSVVDGAPVAFSKAAIACMQASRAVVDGAVARGDVRGDRLVGVLLRKREGWVGAQERREKQEKCRSPPQSRSVR